MSWYPESMPPCIESGRQQTFPSPQNSKLTPFLCVDRYCHMVLQTPWPPLRKSGIRTREYSRSGFSTISALEPLLEPQPPAPSLQSAIIQTKIDIISYLFRFLTILSSASTKYSLGVSGFSMCPGSVPPPPLVAVWL